MAKQQAGQAKGLRLPHLAAYRRRAALSQRELAEKASVTRQTVIRAESGEGIRYSNVRKLADALGVTPEALAGW
ncbi:MAG TPA: helix-turn-helix transcriptional regulator [Ktedonobacterales bacterium]|jgi:DNA-binding XRE family transcriptional regulator|nr:helix-turn-helix transcriptional regulator [Ktedonobacterales bacterium]